MNLEASIAFNKPLPANTVRALVAAFGVAPLIAGMHSNVDQSQVTALTLRAPETITPEQTEALAGLGARAQHIIQFGESETLSHLLGLAKARELLVEDMQRWMPKGAEKQHQTMLAVLDATIEEALRDSKERLVGRPIEGMDAIGDRAWQHLLTVQEKTPLAPAEAVQETAYGQLTERFARLCNLHLIGSVIGWIEHTHHMPELDAATVAEAETALSIASHRLMTAPETAAWLKQAEAARATLDAAQARNLDLMRHDHRRSTALDESLLERLSKASVASNRAWEAAKPKSDFNAWLPYFEEIVALKREVGEKLGAVDGVSPYQALLDGINTELRNETVNRMFGELRQALPGLIQQITAKQAAEAAPLPLPPVPIEAQKRVMHRLMKALGLEEAHARLDESAHPFSTGEWDDVRITTRYREEEMLPALMALVHETGHALYSRALPRQAQYQPIGDAQSIWVHESQSLFWEKQVAESREFMEFLAPILKQELGVDGPEWSPENLHRLVTHVKPGLIRVEADEVTYPLHVVLRHNLEQKLIDGTLAPKDVPAAWATEMKSLLGVEVPDHAHGAMQDVHWPGGSIGYFPGYTFGALGAAQLMEKLKQDMPDVGEHIKKGDFAPIRAWLGEKIHSLGSRYPGEELIARATGKPLSTQPFLDHLKARYLGQEPVQAKDWRADVRGQRAATTNLASVLL